jgi:phage tail sheath protein FI
MSTLVIGCLGRTDYANGDVPFMSPSNHAMPMDGLSWKGKEVILDIGQANYLNSNGIMTALNWIGGWRAWGNKTSAYPGNTDPKDCWIPVRRMFNWVTNEIILTYWQKVDLPIRPVLIDNICTGLNARLAGLVGAGYLLGGRVDWLQAENTRPDILDGKIQFHVYICPPTAAEEIRFVLEYDPGYFEMLAAAVA